MIIRTTRHWFPRLVDTLLTLMAWGVFVYLLVSGGEHFRFDGSQALLSGFFGELYDARGSLLFYLLLSLAFGAVLVGWAKYNQIRAGRYDRRRRRPDLDEQALAQSYMMQACVLGFLQQQRILVAHNDEHGDLVSVEVPALGIELSTRVPLKLQTEPLEIEPDLDASEAVLA